MRLCFAPLKEVLTCLLPIKMTALHLAACCSKLSIIEYLINIPGINMNPLDHTGCTPLDGETGG